MYSKKETVKVNINDLKPHPKNPKLHNDELIEKSINDLGYAENMVIDENNTILAGHGRIKALKKKGETEVEVIRITGWAEEEKEKYLLLANQSTISGGFDYVKLEDFGDNIIQYSGLEKIKIPSDEDWADAFSKDTLPKELDGLKQITFILKDTEIEEILEKLKIVNEDKNRALYEIIMQYDNS